MTMILRPVTADDLERVFELASAASAGLTTLPADREVLEGRISDTEKAPFESEFNTEMSSWPPRGMA